MRNSNRVVNNADRVENRINGLNLEGVNAVADDGSVCVEVLGNLERVSEVVNIINELNLDVNGIGDGVQEGSIWINANDIDLHDEIGSLNLN